MKRQAQDRVKAIQQNLNFSQDLTLPTPDVAHLGCSLSWEYFFLLLYLGSSF